MTKAKRNIKTMSPKMGKKSRYKQGYFNVSSSTKYMKKTEPCIYRSSYEFKFMKWCEHSDIVKQWNSEPFSVKYLCLETGKTRNYWIDFSIVSNKDEFWLIEVKPAKEVTDATLFGKMYEAIDNEIDRQRFAKSRKTAAKNWSKWKHAQQIANGRGWRFILVTENFLKRHT